MRLETPLETPSAQDQKKLDHALRKAAVDGRAKLVSKLLDHGASPLARDDQGRDAFFLAVAASQLECVKALLPVSNVNSVDRENWRPIFFAGLELTDDPHEEADQANARAILELVASHADCDLGNCEGATPLTRAIRNEAWARAEALLPFSNPRVVDQRKRDALMAAALLGHEGMVKSLLDSSDLGAVDKNGLSAIDYANASPNPQLASWIAQAAVAREEKALLEELAPSPTPGPRRSL